MSSPSQPIRSEMSPCFSAALHFSPISVIHNALNDRFPQVWPKWDQRWVWFCLLNTSLFLAVLSFAVSFCSFPDSPRLFPHWVECFLAFVASAFWGFFYVLCMNGWKQTMRMAYEYSWQCFLFNWIVITALRNRRNIHYWRLFRHRDGLKISSKWDGEKMQI